MSKYELGWFMGEWVISYFLTKLQITRYIRKDLVLFILMQFIIHLHYS